MVLLSIKHPKPPGPKVLAGVPRRGGRGSEKNKTSPLVSKVKKFGVDL